MLKPVTDAAVAGVKGHCFLFVIDEKPNRKIHDTHDNDEHTFNRNFYVFGSN